MNQTLQRLLETSAKNGVTRTDFIDMVAAMMAHGTSTPAKHYAEALRQVLDVYDEHRETIYD